jgi:DDE superfamily endonuclease
MNKRSEPRSMLIINNFGTHLSKDLKEICEETKVDLMYLAPYLSDLSPIKESFNRLKQWMRRNKALSLCFKRMFEGFFHLVIKLVVTPEDAKGYFRFIKINVIKEDQDINYNEL